MIFKCHQAILNDQDFFCRVHSIQEPQHQVHLRSCRARLESSIFTLFLKIGSRASSIYFFVGFMISSLELASPPKQENGFRACMCNSIGQLGSKDQTCIYRRLQLQSYRPVQPPR